MKNNKELDKHTKLILKLMQGRLWKHLHMTKAITRLVKIHDLK